MPPGYSKICLEQIDSTNSEALRRAGDGAADRLWIRALSQTEGRGRSGRDWVSAPGNLFASLLLRPGCPLKNSVQLAFVAGLAVFDAVAEFSGNLRDQLALKWPNDLLLQRAKLGGILIESTNAPVGTAPTIVVGTGLNLVSHLEDATMPATNLASHGVTVMADDAFRKLAWNTARWLEIWADSEGWDAVRSAWLERSLRLGAEISVKVDKRQIDGQFAGVDGAGALLVTDKAGTEITITAGDVFLI